jgi:hypothetical protein
MAMYRRRLGIPTGDVLDVVANMNSDDQARARGVLAEIEAEVRLREHALFQKHAQ